MVGEAQDLLLELGDGGEGTAADRLLRDDVEPDLDLVEPGGVGGDKVEVVAGPVGQPTLDAGVLVGGVVVNDEVDVEVRRHVGVDVFEEAQELLMAVARPALGQDPAGGDVQGSEEGGGAVADVAVRDALGVAEPEGQEGLGALQGLALALLVDAQDQGMVGRMKVEADDIMDLLDEEGIGGEPECFCRWGWMLNAVQTRWTVDLETPVASAMERQVQCVPPSGGRVSSVFRSSVMRVSSGMERGRPGRCSS